MLSSKYALAASTSPSAFSATLRPKLSFTPVFDALSRALAEHYDAPYTPAPSEPLDPETAAALEALGYQVSQEPTDGR